MHYWITYTLRADSKTVDVESGLVISFSWMRMRGSSSSCKPYQFLWIFLKTDKKHQGLDPDPYTCLVFLVCNEEWGSVSPVDLHTLNNFQLVKQSVATLYQERWQNKISRCPEYRQIKHWSMVPKISKNNIYTLQNYQRIL